MKLSGQIIFFRLLLKYSVYYLKDINDKTELMRPVFFSADTDISNRVVIISPDNLKALGSKHAGESLLICCGNPSGIDTLPECSVIVFEEDVAADKVFNELQDIFDLFDQWDENLKTLYYEGGSFSDMIDCCDPVTCDPISLTDNMFRFIGFSKVLSEKRGLVASVDMSSRLSIDRVNEMLTSQKFSAISKIKGTNITSPFGDIKGDLLFRNIFYQDEYVGRLMMKLLNNDKHRIRYCKSILEHLYDYIVRLYGKYMSFDKNQIYLNSLRDLLKDALDNKAITYNQWQKAFEENGWSVSDELQLIQFKPNLRYDKNIYADYYSTEIERIWRRCVCFEYHNNLLLFINLRRFESPQKIDFKQALAYFLRETLMVAGISRVFTDMEYLRPAYKQTQIALEFGPRTSPEFWYHYFNDYALSYILSKGIDQFKPEHICSEKLLKLKRYDEEKSTDYYRTLWVYFQSLFNSTEAARRLYIQRSSFHYRMDRIQQLTGIDFNSRRELLYLAISFEIMGQSMEDERAKNE